MDFRGPPKGYTRLPFRANGSIEQDPDVATVFRVRTLSRPLQNGVFLWSEGWDRLPNVYCKSAEAAHGYIVALLGVRVIEC